MIEYSDTGNVIYTPETEAEVNWLEVARLQKLIAEGDKRAVKSLEKLRKTPINTEE